VEEWEFDILIRLSGARRHSMATLGARKVLVDGMTAAAAASDMGVRISTVSRSVVGIKRVKAIADEYVARSVNEAVNGKSKK